MSKRKISILGAGLVGSLTAILLEQRGYEVKVYERRDDMRNQKLSAGRSINLAMSTRGWKALEMAGVKKQIMEIAIPMFGRELHLHNETDKFQAYGKNNEAIYSVSRGALNRKLMSLAEENGVEFFFNQKCTHVDIEKNTFSLNDAKTIEADLLIGADGAFSSLRTAYTKTDRCDYHQFYIEHGYKELSIPAFDNAAHRIKKEALHIWPRESYMMIALPNLDGSFTCTLFFPFEGELSFDSIKTKEDVQKFYSEKFPDAIPLMPNLLEDYFNNPTASLVTIKCGKYTHKEKSLILGDAAHPIVPFYGQGMNAGFEDCSILMELLDKNKHDWTSTLNDFQNSRVKDGHAIADLALQNFIEMRDLVTDEGFLLRKKLEKEIGRLFPNDFNSVYEMVSFSHLPYSYAWSCRQAQDALMNSLVNDKRFKDGIIGESEIPLIEEKLKSYAAEISALA